MREIMHFPVWYSQAGAEGCRENPDGWELFRKVATPPNRAAQTGAPWKIWDEQAETCFALGVKQPLCPNLNDLAPLWLLKVANPLQTKLGNLCISVKNCNILSISLLFHMFHLSKDTLIAWFSITFHSLTFHMRFTIYNQCKLFCCSGEWQCPIVQALLLAPTRAIYVSC